MMKTIAALAVLLTLTGTQLPAEVADAAANGFTSKIAVAIQAPPADVYRKFVHNIGDWWNAQHTFSHDAHNLSIEEKPMGCFCEKLPNGGGVRHMEVLTVMPNKALVLTGALGPLQALATTGTMQIELVPQDTGTLLKVTYTVAGYLAGGMQSWAAPVDGVLTGQLTRLKNYIEQGDPAGKEK